MIADLWRESIATAHRFHRHRQSMPFIECGNNFGYGHAAPCVEEIFRKFAVPLLERLLPGQVMQGHGIGNSAVAVE